MPDEPAQDGLKVFYNSACPVCRAGIEGQRQRMDAQGHCEVEWVDVHRHPETVAALGSDLEQVRERLYVMGASGKVAIGVDAFIELFQQSPRQRWLARLLMLPGVHGLARLGYNLFARALYRWNRWLKHW